MVQHGKHRTLVRGAAAALLVAAAPVAAEPFVHASVSADLTGDGASELAVVVGGSDLALAIWTEDPETFTPKLIGHAAGIAWTQSNEDARLEVTEAGSLRLTTSNFGIGRNKWEQVLTIAWRDGAFRVAGVTFGEFDSLEPETSPRSCDMNLLTGRGDSNYPGGGDPLPRRVDPDAPLIEDWTADIMNAVCGR